MEQNSITLGLVWETIDYNFSSPMVDDPIGVVEVVLGIQWLRTLGIVSTNYNGVFMRFELDEIKYELKGFK